MHYTQNRFYLRLITAEISCMFKDAQCVSLRRLDGKSTLKFRIYFGHNLLVKKQLKSLALKVEYFPIS